MYMLTWFGNSIQTNIFLGSFLILDWKPHYCKACILIRIYFSLSMVLSM